jgi:hypothetical protein
VPQAVSAEEESGSNWIWLIAIALVAAGAVAAFLIARSRRTAR